MPRRKKPPPDPVPCEWCGIKFVPHDKRHRCCGALACKRAYGRAYAKKTHRHRKRDYAIPIPKTFEGLDLRPRIRQCLKCDRDFHSKDINNRICPACAKVNTYIDDPNIGAPRWLKLN